MIRPRPAMRGTFAAAVLTAVFLCPGYGPLRGADPGDADLREARALCRRLETLWRNWHEGLYGSRRHHETALKTYLYTLMGREIATDRVYYLSLEGGHGYGIRLYTPFAHSRWLRIEGPVNEQSIRDITGGDPAKVLSWWRDGPLVAARGTVRDYRLFSNPGGYTVVIVLKEIFLVQDKKAGPVRKK